MKEKVNKMTQTKKDIISEVCIMKKIGKLLEEKPKRKDKKVKEEPREFYIEKY